MWFSGDAQIQRKKLYSIKNIGPKRVSWKLGPNPYAAAISVNPWSFAYAATRVSATGAKVGLRGQLAGGGLSLAALAYLLRHSLPSHTRPSHELRLHNEFNLLKDFVGTSLKGNIGAAFAYLNMLNLGYVWSGHFEDCVAVIPKGVHPDFVFAKSTDVCLVDAKGSASSLAIVEKTAKTEWSRQILPCRAMSMKSGGRPTEGRVIASAMSMSAGMQLVTAHGRFPASPLSKFSDPKSRAQAVGSVQLVNYVDACLLVGLDDIAAGMSTRRREATRDAVVFKLTNVDQKIDELEPVYLGPPKLSASGEREGWSMQIFCRAHILDAAVRKFSGVLPATEIPTTNAILPPAISESENDQKSMPDRVIVQGWDGVGALFRRVLLKD